MSARVFETSDVDGFVSKDFCDGAKHYSRTGDSYSEESEVHVKDLCDGSCKPEARTHNLRELIAKERGVSLKEEDGRILPTVITLDEVLAAMLRTDQPIMAVRFATMYVKRFCRSADYCLGVLHVTWNENFDWDREQHPKTFATHKLVTSPCDGSCRATTTLTRDERRSLRKQERNHKAWLRRCG